MRFGKGKDDIKMDTKQVKTLIHELYNHLSQREDQTAGLMDICDCLLQVYKKIDHVKNPDTLLSALVNYIYMVGFSQKIQFIGEDQDLLRKIASYTHTAGLNAKYRSDLTDKSQFYSFLEKMPVR